MKEMKMLGICMTGAMIKKNSKLCNWNTYGSFTLHWKSTSVISQESYHNIKVINKSKVCRCPDLSFTTLTSAYTYLSSTEDIHLILLLFRSLLSFQRSSIFFIEKWTWLHLTGKVLSGKPVIMILDKNLMDSLYGETSLECGQSAAMMIHSILHQEKSPPAIIVLNGTILSKKDIRVWDEEKYSCVIIPEKTFYPLFHPLLFLMEKINQLYENNRLCRLLIIIIILSGLHWQLSSCDYVVCR